MPTQVLISHPNWFRLVKGKTSLDMKVDKFVFEMEFTKHVLKMLDENPVFQAKLWDAATKQWKEMLEELKGRLSFYDGAIKDSAKYYTPDDFEKFKARQLNDCKGDCETILTRYRAQMTKSVDAEWAKIRKQNKLANEFKIKTVFKAIGRTIAVTSSVLALVASGGLNFVAYFTLARSISASVAEMKSLCKPVDKLGAEIQSDIKKFSKSVTHHPKLKKAKDVSNTLTFALLGAEFTRSYTSINKKIKTLQTRLALMQQKQMRLGKDVKKLMDKVAKEKSKADKATQVKMAKLEKALNTLLVKVSKLGKQFLENEKIATESLKHLQTLQKATGRAILNVTEKVVMVVANITKFVLSAAVLDAATASDAVASLAESLSKS